MKLRHALIGVILLGVIVYKSLDEFDEILIGECPKKIEICVDNV